jgi:hypothetical protein
MKLESYMKHSQGVILLFLLILVVALPVLFPIRREGFQENKGITGRYLHLQHTQGTCINLAEIRAYGYKGGPNLVTPQTAITMSSRWHDPANGRSEFATDRNEDTIIHTACDGKDIPWIRVDLGSLQPIHKIFVLNRKDCCINRTNGLVLSVLDEQQKPVYVSEPIKDKKGRTTYVDTQAEYTNQTDYYRTFTWYPPHPAPLYDALDEDDLPSNLRCRDQSTAFDLDGGGNLIYLDRQRVFCGPDEVMRGFHLVRESAQFPGKVRYNFQCCKVSAPLSPSHPFLTKGPNQVSQLEKEVQGIQKQLREPPSPPSPPPLPADIVRAPERVDTLEQDVKKIRQELEKVTLAPITTSVDAVKAVQSQAAPPPTREDIVPENQLTDTGVAATAMGKQSSFLRDLRQMIQNEIRSHRATDPLLPV